MALPHLGHHFLPLTLIIGDLQYLLQTMKFKWIAGVVDMLREDLTLLPGHNALIYKSADKAIVLDQILHWVLMKSKSLFIPRKGPFRPLSKFISYSRIPERSGQEHQLYLHCWYGCIVPWLWWHGQGNMVQCYQYVFMGFKPWVSLYLDNSLSDAKCDPIEVLAS